MLGSTLAILLLGEGAVHAYVGPGAGFALLSSFFVLLVSGLAFVLSLLAWPFRALWRAVTGRGRTRPAIRRLVIVGFDGQDPGLTDRFMSEGRLPNFAALAARGAYRRLRTTFPPICPVAWSSFSTGCEPSHHSIFDSVEPDRQTDLPARTATPARTAPRFLRVGGYRIPLSRPRWPRLRQSKPFWSILGEHRIWSTILRVPMSFPPDRFYGAQLSAMSVPDVFGTAGTFLLFTTRPAGPDVRPNGQRIPLAHGRDIFETAVPGPENVYRAGSPRLTVPLRLAVDRTRRVVAADIDGTRIDLAPGRLSDWLPLRFRAAPGVTVTGLSRWLVTEMDDHLSVYVSPINLDPARPALTISQPSFYARYLARRIGPFATLGLAEDTGALDAGITDEATFLRQTYDIDREREAQCVTALDRLRAGTLVCVFDATDRIQHMFWRDFDPSHPAGHDREGSPHRHAVRELYEHNDALLGRIVKRLQPDDVLMVISDHGFSSFRRSVNLNVWLRDEGYLSLKPGASGEQEWLRDIDWSRTRAYCAGLTGLYLNLDGRESHGVVKAGAEAVALKAELVERLSGLRDVDTGEVGIREAFDTASLYQGPFRDKAPDILIGFNAGYRTSGSCARGVVAGPVFQDNDRPWSGDHAIDPRLVPGVFFCNRPTETAEPSLVDIAPTVLRLFGIEPPGYMDGRPLANLP